MDYYLIPNTLADDGSYMARVVAGKSYTSSDLIDLVLSERNLLSRPDLEGAMAALEEAIVRIVREGNSLNLPWLKLGYAMKGRFAHGYTKRNPENHPLEISVNAGSLLTDALAEIELKRVNAPDFGAHILRFMDHQSQTSNKLLTPGGIFKIVGKRLRIDGDQSDAIGLYLRDQNLKETQVSIILNNEPTHLSGQLPDSLAPGVYQLVIRTQVGASGNRFLKEVRTSFSHFDLTVE